MKVLMFFFAAIVLCTATFAIGELGSLDVARKEHPAIFVPGNVLEYSVGGVPGYVFNGGAERCFEGDMAESDSELYQEAVLDAKGNLHKFLQKKSGSKSMQMSGAVKLYEYPDGKMRRVVMFVAKESVAEKKEPVPEKKEAASEKKESVAEKKEAVSESLPHATANENAAKEGAAAKTPESQPVKQELPVPPVTNAATTASKASEKAEGIAVATDKVDRVAACLKQAADDPTDCIAMSRAAKLHVRQGDLESAKRLYAKIVNVIIADEKMDKEFASSLLMEAARFEKSIGDINLALKYYRLLVRCDGLRRWKLHEQVREANKNISELLLAAP